MATIGDADHLRRTAAVLNDRAAELSGLAHRLECQTSAMVFAGPAADEFRSAMNEKRQQLTKAAGDLRDAADVMVRSAFGIESETGCRP